VYQKPVIKYLRLSKVLVFKGADVIGQREYILLIPLLTVQKK
jgi:hypothetical protein